MDKCPKSNIYSQRMFHACLLKVSTILLKAYSQAYILITLIPVIISFIIRTRLSVSTADLNL